jgi:hypothetical protein
LAQVFDLINRIESKRNLPSAPLRVRSIERKANELIDWLVDSDLRQWQAVNEHLADRRRTHQERIVGDMGIGSFHHDREQLIDELAARRSVNARDLR